MYKERAPALKTQLIKSIENHSSPKLTIETQDHKALSQSINFLLKFLHCTHLFCGALTKAADIFWSMKKRRDKQNPNPHAPKTACQGKDFKLTIFRTSMISSSEVSKLFFTEMEERKKKELAKSVIANVICVHITYY